MKIKRFTLGSLRSNCYIVHQNQNAIIIDPGYDSDEVIDFINEQQLNVLYIYATHGHIDHVGGIKILKEMYNAKVYAPKKDEIFMIESPYNRLGYRIPVDGFIDEGFSFFLDDYEFKVFSTPGHSEGGTILYNPDEHICFSGDTLFFQTIGRTDLPFSDFSKIKSSIEKMYELLPNHTKIYPGHGRETTIGHEKLHNMFIRYKKQANR